MFNCIFLQIVSIFYIRKIILTRQRGDAGDTNSIFPASRREGEETLLRNGEKGRGKKGKRGRGKRRKEEELEEEEKEKEEEEEEGGE